MIWVLAGPTSQAAGEWLEGGRVSPDCAPARTPSPPSGSHVPPDLPLQPQGDSSLLPPHPCLEGFIFGQVISIALLINIISIKEKVMVGEKGGWGRGLHMPVIVSTVRPQCSDSLL